MKLKNISDNLFFQLKKWKKTIIPILILVISALMILLNAGKAWTDRNENSSELLWTDNTTGYVLSAGQCAIQSFVAEGDYLEDMSIMMVPWDDYSHCPNIQIKNENDGVIYVGELSKADIGNIFSADVHKWTSNKAVYTLTLIVTEGQYTIFMAPDRELPPNAPDTIVVNDIESENVLLFSSSWKDFSFGEFFLFIVPVLLLVCVTWSLRKESEGSLIGIAASYLSLSILWMDTVNKLSFVQTTGSRLFSGIITIIFLFNLLLTLTGLCKSPRVAVLLFSTLEWIFGLICHYVMVFRGSPFVPIDIMAVGTAAQVAGNYVFSIDNTVVYSGYIYVISLAVSFTYAEMMKEKVAKKRTYLILTMLINIVLFIPPMTNHVYGMAPNYISQETGMEKYGVPYNFLVNIQGCIRKKPRNYSSNQVKEIASEYPSEMLDSVNKEKLPNIIAVMNESWSEIEESVRVPMSVEQITPNIARIAKEKNAVKGKTVVHTFGGGTHWSEFEFLTGGNVNYDLTGAIYNYDVRGNIYSIVSTMKQLGYYTVALHPASAENWDRNIGYEKLGFDKFLSIEELREYEFDYPRKFNYPSDSSLYNVIYDLTEDLEQPVFIFCITLQNHGSYDDPSYESTVDTDDKQLGQYLTLMKETDTAFKELIDHYRTSEKDTLIFMFGDHLPSIEHVESYVSKDSVECYETPYICWSNFEVKDDLYYPYCNVGFLQVLLMRRAGLPLTGWQLLLEDMAGNHTVYWREHYYNSELQELFQEEIDSELVKDYRIMQYNNLSEVEDKTCKVFFTY